MFPAITTAANKLRKCRLVMKPTCFVESEGSLPCSRGPHTRIHTYFSLFVATAPIWALAYLDETLRFTSVF
jgi:hypothetical protein